MNKGSKFQHRQQLADMLEQFLMQSEVLFSDQELSKEWFNAMMQQASAIQGQLAVFNYVSHEQQTHQAIFDSPAVTETPAPELVETPVQAPEVVVAEEVPVSTPEVQELPETVNEEPAPVAAEEPAVEEAPVEKPVVVEAAPIVEEEVEEPAAEVSEVLPEEPALVEKVLIAENEELVEQPVAEEEVVETQEEAADPVAEASSEAPSKEKEEKEINDLLGKTPTLADRLKVKPIGKLADSISLNERFLFSNELFNGNMEAFKRALNELDHIASLTDAQRYIDVQLRVENEWDNNSFTVKSFVTLVERKFQ